MGAIHSLASSATFRRASRSWRPNEVPLCQAPDWSLNGREKIVEKNGPFGPLPAPPAGGAVLPDCRLDVAASQPVPGFVVGSHLGSSLCEMKLALSRRQESQRTFQGGTTRQRPVPANRRGPSGGSDGLAGASGAPRRCEPARLPGARAGRPVSVGYHKNTKRVGNEAIELASDRFRIDCPTAGRACRGCSD